jgi:hypothetical protein
VFDLRYHVASLAAVFLALIVGILVGVAITRGGFVSKAERKVLNDRIAEAQHQRDAARQHSSQLEQDERAEKEYVTDTYPALMAGRLAGMRIAVVSVGPMDSGTRASVLQTLQDAGAPPPVRIRAIAVPVDLKALDHALAGRAALAKYDGSDRLPDLGRALAQEVVHGGKTPLWDALSSQLVEERLGAGRPAADGVVVARSVKPQQGLTARFLDGLYSGLAGAGEPAVGVEPSGQSPSPIPAFERAALSTVDSIDTEPGKLALALLLAGGAPGHYGVRTTASDGLLPPFEASATASG